jgi:hypothetical protein
METVRLLNDTEWAMIDGRLCLVTDFSPMAKVEHGTVQALSATTPYASVRLTCERSPDEITGFVTHKMDFAMLWAAFKNRNLSVPGIRVEVLSPEASPDSLGPHEEVLLVWTRQNYAGPLSLFARLFPRVWPSFVVMVCPKGAFELTMDNQLRPELRGEARFAATRPLVRWTPVVMRR